MAQDKLKPAELLDTNSGGFMKRRKNIAALLTGLAILIFVAPAFAAKITVTGKVSNDMKILAEDGTVYDIAEDDMGETVIVYTGKKVQVTGKVKAKDGKKILTVEEFKVMN
jgi:hypothetical protein